jgi:hypothetical protein
VTAPEKAPERRKLILVYRGATPKGAPGELLYAYSEITGWPKEPVIGKERLYSKRVHGLSQPGAVVEIDGNDTAVFPGSDRFLSLWPDRARMAEWQAASDATTRAAEAYKAGKKEGARRLDLEALEPLRRAYRALPAPARAQLLARVVAWLTAPGRD